MTVECKPISNIYLHDLFHIISDEIGYTTEVIEESDYLTDLEDLVELWTRNGFIEIYEHKKDKQYGRAKSSDSVPNSVPWYIGLYHARLVDSEDNDPLIVITFNKDENDDEKYEVYIRFMLDHDDMFGPQDNKTKFNEEKMRSIRKRIDAFIQRGN